MVICQLAMLVITRGYSIGFQLIQHPLLLIKQQDMNIAGPPKWWAKSRGIFLISSRFPIISWLGIVSTILRGCPHYTAHIWRTKLIQWLCLFQNSTLVLCTSSTRSFSFFLWTRQFLGGWTSIYHLFSCSLGYHRFWPMAHLQMARSSSLPRLAVLLWHLPRNKRET